MNLSEKQLETLSLLIQITGFLIVFIIAWIIRRKKFSIYFGFIFMFFVNFVAQVIIAGEGPGACVGAFALPFMGMFVAWFGNDISKSHYARKESQKKKDSDQSNE